MGKKDKKKVKGSEKTAAKTEKKVGQKLKKELAAKGEDDIETVLAKIAEEDKRKKAVVEELVPPPSKRTSFSIVSHPDKDQLIMFGGEYFNGTKTFLYNDLLFYTIKQDRWHKVSSPGGPPPRAAHQTVALSQGGGQLWVFGGEFTSQSQSQFYHYKDLWVFHLASKKWEKIMVPGGPSSRSGHRMVAVKKQLIVFGGFHDTTRDFKYYNDVYSFNLENYEWKKLDVAGNGPCPRSGCQMIGLSDGRVIIYGGYSKEKVKKDVDKGVTHMDMFLLVPDKHDTTGTKWRWQTAKQGAIRPSLRCAFSMTHAGGDKALLFGGVCDEEDDEELEGMFFNELYQLDLTKIMWNLLTVTGKKDLTKEKKKRRRKIPQEGEEGGEEEYESESGSDEEEMKVGTEVQNKLENLSVGGGAVAKEIIVSDDGVFTVTINECSTNRDLGSCSKNMSNNTDIFTPPPRINAGMAVKRGVLYLYGGLYEEGDKQLALNDFYSLDLNKMEEWKTIIALKPKDLEWFDSDTEDDDEDDDDDDEDEDDDDDMDEDVQSTGGMDIS